MRKVTILGSARPSSLWANDLPPDVELWGMNLDHQFLTRPCQRYFQMHHRMHNSDNGNPPGHFGRPLVHEEFLRTCGIPVFMQEVDPFIPTSIHYPIEDIEARFGSYFTSTAAYMMALALYERVDELGLLGLHLDRSDEYTEQKPCIEYYLGIAKEMGVTIRLPADCDLTKAPRYAYDEMVPKMDGLVLESVEVM